MSVMFFINSSHARDGPNTAICRAFKTQINRFIYPEVPILVWMSMKNRCFFPILQNACIYNRLILLEACFPPECLFSGNNPAIVYGDTSEILNILNVVRSEGGLPELLIIEPDSIYYLYLTRLDATLRIPTSGIVNLQAH